MSKPQRPLLAELKHEIGSLGSDLRQSAELRWQLAELELRAAAGDAKRLAIQVAVAAVVAMTALPVLVAALGTWLDTTCGIAAAGWMAIFGLGLLAAAIGGGLLAWRRFRRRFVGLQQTLEELREDRAWLSEWLGREESDGDLGF